MDDASIRERLAGAQGPQYWRCLEELMDDEGFRAHVRRRLGSQLPEPFDALGRRQFLGLLGASLALAGLSGCGLQPPQEKIVPYARPPANIIPGIPQFYATTMVFSGEATGVVVESHEGRPTKIEGNEKHPASLGGTDPFVQASILTLYDPDRAQTVTQFGQIQSAELANRAIQTVMAKLRPRRGSGLRLLTETVISPTLASQIKALLRELPEARWYQYEPLGAHSAREGARLALGDYVNSYYRVDRAEVIVSLDADFLLLGPGHLRYAREFIDGRRTSSRGGVGKTPLRMNRLYALECEPTITGAKADHRFAVRASQVEAFARELAGRIDPRYKPLASAVSLGVPEKVIDAIARDLQKHRGKSLVIAGQCQPPAVHALAHAINHALGNAGQTVIYTDPVEAQPTDQISGLRHLADEMERGEVQALVILGGNPVYTAPSDLKFAKLLSAKDERGRPKVPFRLHLSLYSNETSSLCDWLIPQSHYLEAWSDARTYDGTTSIVQPLIAPLYNSWSEHSLLNALLGKPQRLGFEVVQDYWFRHWQHLDASRKLNRLELDRLWQTALHDGVITGTAHPAREVPLDADLIANLRPAEEAGSAANRTNSRGRLEVIFRPDPTIYDGSLANNAWLQELPKPLTKLTWENAALMSPATAQRLGLKSRIGSHGEVFVDAVEVTYRGRTLPKFPVCIVAGHPDDAVTLHLGYGRTRAGHVGTGLGADIYAFRTIAAMWHDTGLEIRPTSAELILACTQRHHLTENRDLVRSTTVEKLSQAPSLPVLPSTESGEHVGMVADWEYPGNRWALAIDLTACVGCNACVVACQAENNIPVVGKDQVSRGREMHWVRIAQYHEGDAQQFRTYFQPLPCMHCERAPCEMVCPVEATVHSSDGLNDMVYNRCVGTRYCSNNCPYKVRRFNFLQYSEIASPTRNMQYNPDVTVRSRGVMEKCTYCVQRIREAEIRARVENRPIRDGDVVTACQAACPTKAIVFGDLNDPDAQIGQWRHHPLNYALLGELNTQPRTTYLSALWNPNPEIEAT